MFALRRLIFSLLLALALGLLLSNAWAAGGARNDVAYVVKPGDTLWGIAAEHYSGDPRSGVWRLQERNGLAGPALTPGTVLYLPP